MVNNKHSIRNSKSRFRIRILEYASTVKKFNVHLLHDWYYDKYPKDTPSKRKLANYLSMINELEKLGYATYSGKTNMEYRLRSE